MQKKYIVPYIPMGSNLGEQELLAVKNVLESGETLSCGKQRDLFEMEFANYIGTKYAKSLTSCTIALEFASHLLKLKKGDEIITTPMTYQATSAHLLTIPVKVNFCDIDENSLSLSVRSIKEKITSKTKAIYLTHYGGLMANMEEIMEVANKRNIVVIADCAHSNGSEINGKKAGSIAHIGCFSFQSYKNMTTLGEGGMMTFNDDKWKHIIDNIRSIEPEAEFLKKNVVFGKHSKPKIKIEFHDKNSFTHQCIKIEHCGTNSTLSEPACAVGRVQLKKLEMFNNKRRSIAHKFDDALQDYKGIRIQKVPMGFKHAYHLYTFFVEKECVVTRNEFIEKLNKLGIEIVLRYFPNHLLPEWRFLGNNYGDCPVTEDIWFNKMINLPIYPQLTELQIDHIITSIKKILEK